MLEEIERRVLYRDALMIVVDKPAGIAVHRGPKGGPSLEDSFEALRFGLPRRPALAHRLDRETSGCLVLGRHRQALAQLGTLFRQGLVGKTYWAIVAGAPATEAGRIDLPLGRLDASRGWWMRPDPSGVEAVTLWRVLGRAPVAGAGPMTWLALMPLTGRTHQLRVHCAAMGWPIVGEGIYQEAPEGAPPLQLHAVKVAVPLYRKRPAIEVCAPGPDHMRARLAACGWPQPVPGEMPPQLPSRP